MSSSCAAAPSGSAGPAELRRERAHAQSGSPRRAATADGVASSCSSACSVSSRGASRCGSAGCSAAAAGASAHAGLRSSTSCRQPERACSTPHSSSCDALRPTAASSRARTSASPSCAPCWRSCWSRPA
eukprot:scaffold68901_cov55-Phaeocystis_antarctica.AAC.1